MPPGQLHAVERAQENPASPRTSSGGKSAAREQPLLAVEVDEDAIHERRALLESAGDRRPLGRFDQERDRVEFPRPGDPPGVAVDVVGHAVVSDEAASLVPPPLHLGDAEHLDGARPSRDSADAARRPGRTPRRGSPRTRRERVTGRVGFCSKRRRHLLHRVRRTPSRLGAGRNVSAAGMIAPEIEGERVIRASLGRIGSSPLHGARRVPGRGKQHGPARLGLVRVDGKPIVRASAGMRRRSRCTRRWNGRTSRRGCRR